MKISVFVLIGAVVSGSALAPQDLEAQALTREEAEAILARAVLIMVEEHDHFDYSQPALLYAEVGEGVEKDATSDWSGLGRAVANAVGLPLWDSEAVCDDGFIKMKHNDFGLGPTLSAFQGDTAHVSVKIGPILNDEIVLLFTLVRTRADWRLGSPDIGKLTAAGEPCVSSR